MQTLGNADVELMEGSGQLVHRVQLVETQMYSETINDHLLHDSPNNEG